MKIADFMTKSLNGIGTFKRNFDTAISVGGVVGASVGAATMLGLPIPTAAGISVVAAAHLAGVMIDLYKIKNFKSTYGRFMELLEKREVILKVMRSLTSPAKGLFIKHTRKDIAALDKDIKFFGNRLDSLVSGKMKETTSLEERDALVELKQRISDAVKRKTSLSESEEVTLDEALAPIMLTYRLIKKLKDDSETNRNLALLGRIFYGESNKYSVSEMLGILLGDFVRDYRRGLITASEFVVVIGVTVEAIEKNDPSILLNHY